MSEKVVQMENEIEDRRKLTDEVKQNIITKLFKNVALTAIYMLLIIIINLIFLNIKSNIFSMIAKFASVISMFITIIIFEISYKKENLEYALCAIEMLIISIIIMYIPYAYIHLSEDIKRIIMLTPVYFAIYCFVKNIITVVKLKKDYFNSLSDVKEIVKDEENTSYLDEDSKKIIKEANEVEAKKEEERKLKKENKKKQKKQSKKKK